MRTKIFSTLIIVLSICSCKKDDLANIEHNIDGDYTGVFERNSNASKVKLTFNDGTWTGESELSKFPALCNGTYSILGDVITFKNTCVWTADFDWTLILGNEWNYSLNGDSLVLTKKNGDKYTLTKQ